MALFKIGVGYPTSPRSKAIFNLQWSRSSAETTNIGTAGTASVPIFVNFTDYNYWGFEGGQRFYFTRLRFTPYVGYLAGLSHNGEIKGTFVNVPPTSPPISRRRTVSSSTADGISALDPPPECWSVSGRSR
jgi:hypothetical protein